MDSPNVLLVVLDSVRARNCGIHGHRNETTPFLAQFNERSTLFEQARAPSIHSIASHTSIFSGYHVEEHNVTNHGSYLQPEATIWHALAEKHGYDTGIFTPNVVVAEASNLAEPFETCKGPRRTRSRLFEEGLGPDDLPRGIEPRRYLQEALQDEAPIRSVLNGMYSKLTPMGGAHDPHGERADVYVDELLTWVDERQGPWAACLNLMDAHYPYVPKEEHDRWGGERVRSVHDGLPDGPNAAEFVQERPWGELRALEPLYDGCIRQLDTALERLVGELESRDELEETLLVITSDHGEGFGERSRLTPPVRYVDHSFGLGEVLTHVPLLVREPGQQKGRRISDPASLTQFPDVVRAAIEGKAAADAFLPENGRVLSSTFRIEPPGEELPLEKADREPYFGPWRAVYRKQEGSVLKYATRGGDAIAMRILDAQTAYPVDEDTDIVDETFEGLVDVGVRQGDATQRAVDEDVEDRLADLGYMR